MAWDEAKAERQRLRRANMTAEQVEVQRERSRTYSKTKRVRPEGHKYNRQHRRRILETSNHSAYSIRIGKTNYNELFKQFSDLQNGCCAICGKTEEAEGRRLALDHDHETGVVRGLLCLSCNQALGWYEAKHLSIHDYLEWSEF